MFDCRRNFVNLVRTSYGDPPPVGAPVGVSAFRPEGIIGLLAELKVLFSVFKDAAFADHRSEAGVNVILVFYEFRNWFVCTSYALDRPTVAAMLNANFNFMVDILFGNYSHLTWPEGSTYASARAHAINILGLNARS